MSLVHILRGLLIKLVLISCILSIILIVLPYLIDFDLYRPKILEQVERRLPGQLQVEQMKLSLFPIPAIVLKNAALAVKSPEGETALFLTLPEAKLALNIRTLFGPTREFTLQTQEATFHLKKWPSGEWSLKQALSLPYLLKPAAADQKENTSWFEDIVIIGFKARNVRFSFAGMGDTGDMLKNILLSFPGEGWRATFRIPTMASMIGKRMAECDNRTFIGTDSVDLTISNSIISVERWQNADKAPAWSGTISWQGKIELESSGRRLKGTLPQVTCM